MALVRIEDISKSFGSTCVLRDVSLDIADSEFLTLLGPSGCGKSTLLRIIAGLETQDRGAIVIGGRSVDALRPKQRDVAMVFQSYALYPHLTVAQNIAVPLRMRRLNGWQRLPLLGGIMPGTRAISGEIDNEVSKVAKSIGIEHLLARKPGQLSGGQRQRVAVGRAMVRHPSVFLMDEPLSNLDAKLRVQLRAEIKEMHQRIGATFIYVTHDQAEAMTLSDRVAVMLEGELLQVAPPSKIYSDPADRRVAEFIGSPKINILAAKVRDRATVDVAGSVLSLATGLVAGKELSIGIRPEALTPSETGGANALTGRVRFVEHLGSDLFVHLDVPGSEEPVIARLLADRSVSVETGQTMHLNARPDGILLFDADGRRLEAGQGAKVAALRSIA